MSSKVKKKKNGQKEKKKCSLPLSCESTAACERPLTILASVQHFLHPPSSLFTPSYVISEEGFGDEMILGSGYWK